MRGIKSKKQLIGQQLKRQYFGILKDIKQNYKILLQSLKIGQALNTNIIYYLQDLKKYNGIPMEEIDISFYKTKKMNFTQQINLQCKGQVAIHMLINGIIRYNSFNRHLQYCILSGKIEKSCDQN